MYALRCKSLALGCALLALASAAPAQTELTLDREVYVPGEPVAVTFRNGPGNVKDWAGLYLDGAPLDTYVDWQYLDGSQVGSITVTDGTIVFPTGAPAPGSYLVRILINDGYSVAASQAFTVEEVPRVRTDKSTYKPGEGITVNFLNGPGNAKDWVALYKADPPVTTLLDWYYVDGTQNGNTIGVKAGTLPFPGGISDPGDYVAYFFENDSFVVLDSAPFTVQSVGPAVTLIPGNGQVRLTWEAVTQPAPVAKYEVLSAAGPDQPLTRLAEVTGLEYLHPGLVNGVEICYAVRAVSGTGTLGPESTRQCTAPYALGPNSFISYQVPPGTIGNYGFNGSLGMDFEVINPVQITELGVFDDGANGIKRDLKVILYNRATLEEVTSLVFQPQSPGTFKGGSRFKPLAAPVNLPLGFLGTIVAEGFGPEEKAGNAATKELGLGLETGGDSLFFTSSRFGVAGAFPISADSGQANLYAAGTFQFSTTAPVAPGKPIVTAIPGDASVTLFWQNVKRPLPAATYRVSRAASLQDPFVSLGVVNDTAYLDTTVANGSPVFYTVTAVATGGAEGTPSQPVEANPDPPTAGAAYNVPAFTRGNQSFNGSAGNDFDVVRPMRITRLGVFDDGSDGLNRPIKCRLYDRQTKAELAFLQFTTADSGELIEGSRFKNLPQPVDLPIGFKGAIVASGYGEGEQDGNRGVGPMPIETFTGGCVRFVGRSRWGENPDAFPEIIDGGPADRYAAGTFHFVPLDETPEAFIRLTGGKVQLDWNGVGVIQSAPTPAGPWDLVLGAVSGTQFTPSQPAQFYRVRVKP